jgi:arginyl-tRNA synthetase
LNRTVKKQDQKIIVEHTSINPNKAAHIGHLRNACLGDTLVRALKFLGYRVEIQNYIDDTGVQVADVVWGLLYLENKGLEQIKKIQHLATYLWHLYARVHKLDKEDSKIIDEIHQVLKKIEEKKNPEQEVGNYISREVQIDHLKVMESIGIRYDLLVRESDIIEMDFFTRAADILKKKKVMHLSDDPEKKGCWVIKYDRENIEKIIIRSNNTITYIGKDIAYALWKVGLLKRDFYYQEFFKYQNKEKIYTTSSETSKEKFGFGNAKKVYNVIGIRQSYLQNIISQVLNSLGPANLGDHFIHFSYEMVALTPRCVKEMGFVVSADDEKRTYVDVSGRKGIAIPADELIEKLTEKTLEEVTKRHPQMGAEPTQKIAREIAIGALRYFMIKFNSKSVIAFDFKDALAFEGDTGPYLQYTLVRIKSILRKMGKSELTIESKGLDISNLEKKELDLFFEIVLQISTSDSQIEFAINNQEISGIANFTYSICQKFNQYYHLYPIIAEKRIPVKQLRLSLVLLVKKKLENLFYIMGIPVPEKM